MESFIVNYDFSRVWTNHYSNWRNNDFFKLKCLSFGYGQNHQGGGAKHVKKMLYFNYVFFISAFEEKSKLNKS